MNLSPLIKITSLEKTYRDEGEPTPALRGVSFSVDNGEFVAIMGPSGCGKSTLLHILGFLDRQTEGTYEFEGRSMDSYTDEELAHVRNKKMGFVFQTFNLLPRLTVLENVKLPLLYSGIKESLWGEKAKQAIEAVGLTHRINHESSKLSGGEKQRVAIARALVNDPQVIFADEPTGNLDSKSGQAVMSIIQKLNIENKRTIILVTHETYTAEHAQRIIRLLDGKVESDKSVDSRRASEEFVK
ncbi:MAG: ABC transporter ATP-binding protein [Candidatus Liptonbacteria bacterium]|nr:ABC transporter ATP-binding protein [Candidatus Liptonbacteria bacterium]